MTLKQRIDADGMGMRWIRTAATTITAIAAAAVVLWSAITWTIGPRMTEWAESLVMTATLEQRREIEQVAGHLDRLDGVVEALEQTTSRLAEASLINPAPSWRFDPVETLISDGEIGGEVTISAAGYKLRDCGVPQVDLYFVNGSGVYHRFTDSSLLTPDGRGVAAPVNPDRLYRINYTATIPVDDNVSPGRARGYISVTYPDACPAVQPAVAGPLQFRITG